MKVNEDSLSCAGRYYRRTKGCILLYRSDARARSAERRGDLYSMWHDLSYGVYVKDDSVS